jgi:hypothetical protein
MLSPAGSSTGVQITRKASLQPGAARVQLDLSFRNISERARRWSIWDVIQLDAGKDGAPNTGCVMTAPLNPASRFEQGFWVMFGEQDNPQWRADRDKGLFVGQYQWHIGKIGCDSRGGWIAFSDTAAGYGFVGRFTVFPGQEYPDQGSTIECWTVGKGQVANLDYENSGIYLMEAELLSPFFTMQPGEQAHFSIEWAACRSAGMIVDVSDGAAFSEPVTISRSGRSLKVRGVFGVFDQGELSLAWLDAAGDVLARQTLQSTDPTKLVRLNLTANPPSKSAQMELAVVDRMGRNHLVCIVPFHLA